MFVHQNYEGLQIISLRSECSDTPDEIIHIYNPGRGEFIVTGKKGFVPLQKRFAELLAEGTTNTAYKAALLIRDFQFLHDELKSTLEPKFQPHDVAIDKRYTHSGLTFHAVNVLEVANIKRRDACLTDGTKTSTIEIRYKVEDTKTGEQHFRDEGSLLPIYELDKAKSDEKLFRALKKFISDQGVDAMGAVVVYKNGVYKF